MQHRRHNSNLDIGTETRTTFRLCSDKKTILTLEKTSPTCITRQIRMENKFLCSSPCYRSKIKFTTPRNLLLFLDLRSWFRESRSWRHWLPVPANKSHEISAMQLVTAAMSVRKIAEFEALEECEPACSRLIPKTSFHHLFSIISEFAQQLDATNKHTDMTYHKTDFSCI